jgi:eukaryotic-like serine/threonine-protein kinase
MEGADPVLAEGTRVGDFRIQRLLGEGAMGQVYLAQDTTLGRPVALKLIKRSVMQRDGAERFLEEARATASFNHPHIVTLYAVGEHDGRPYLALEYIDGPSLRARLAAGPLAIREALRCCRAVAEAIAEAHRRGLVHSDLKPENVILPNDGRVRVVDFGLAKLAQGAPDATSGTPAYMAPERWRGAPPTGAIDVWALGVMLHELITGRRPIGVDAFFHGLFTADVIELPGLPAAPWAQLVRHCLAVDPAARPAAGEVVRQLIAMLDPHDASDDDDSGGRANGPAVVSQLAETQPFEGRRETMAALVHGVRAVLASKTPMLVTIRGEAGIGKTRLATALHRAMTQAIPEVRVLSFRAQDHGVGEIDETLRSILRRLLVSPSEVTVRPEEMRAHLQAQVGDLWPAVALTLGWIERDAPELLQQAQAPGALRIAAIEATGGLIRRTAEQTPLCIILDDAHLADATTLDALELATRARAGAAPLWICVFVRPSFDASRPAWGERAACAEVIELAPLPDAAAEELCRALLHPAENLPAQLVASLTARAQGNAMLLGELCRALKTEGIIRQERTGAWILETDRVDTWPRTPQLQWLAARELRRLAPELVGPAQLATVLGPRFAVADMSAVIKVLEASPAAHRFALDPMVALTRLEQAQLLRVRGRDHCELRNAALCETMRAAIPRVLRVELHRAAYEHYRDLRRLPEAQRRSRVAFHAAEAGLREPAARAYEALAAENLYRHRYVEAESAFSRMLALVDEAPQRQVALHGRGLARYRIGRYEDALDDLRQAHEVATELGDRHAKIALLLDEATVLDWLNNYRRSAALVDEAATLVGADPEPVIAARIAMGRARSLWRLGKIVEARARLLEAIRCAEAAGDAAYESLVVSLLMLGAVLSDLGEIGAAHDVFERILTLARTQGDRLHELAALNNRRKVWIAEKDAARAAADLHALLEIGRTLGLVLVELVGSYNLGELLYQTGDLEAAWPHVEHAVALAARRSDLLPRPLARLLEIRLLAFEGRWQEAQGLGAEIAELHRAAQAQGRLDAALRPSEELLLDAVLLAAGGTDAAWAELRARAVRSAEDQHAIEVIEIQALGALRAGDLTGAGRALEEALGVARAIPNVMEARLLRRFSALGAAR